MSQSMAGLSSSRERKLSSKKKKVRLRSTYSTDMGLILYWLKLNNAVSSSGKVEKKDNHYEVSVTPKASRQEIKNLVKDRFGVFADVL